MSDRDTVLRLAREAWGELAVTMNEEPLMKFYALATARERQRLESLAWGPAQKWISDAIEFEREACARVCESRVTPGTGSVAILNGAAGAIRARGRS